MANYSFDVSVSGTTAVITFTSSVLPLAGTTAADWRVFDVETEELVKSGYDDFEIKRGKATVVITVTKLTVGKSYIIEVDYDGNTYAEIFDVEADKPTSFKWDIAKASDQPLRVSASEWNAFTSKINEFLKYKGKSAVTFTKAVSAGLGNGAVVGGNHGLSEGKVISANIVNEAVRALESMGITISEVSSNQTITADFFNNLVTKLNSIK